MAVRRLPSCRMFQGNCDDKKVPSARSQVNRKTHPLHRFVLAAPLKDVAFDTQTGQLCRTWDWSISGEVKADTEGHVPERKIGELTPTCLSLYESYPTEGEAYGPPDSQADLQN